MKENTNSESGKRLKRLAKNYADAWADVSWIGSGDPADDPEIRARYRKARKALYEAIDAVTCVAQR